MLFQNADREIAMLLRTSKGETFIFSNRPPALRHNCCDDQANANDKCRQGHITLFFYALSLHEHAILFVYNVKHTNDIQTCQETYCKINYNDTNISLTPDFFKHVHDLHTRKKMF